MDGLKAAEAMTRTGMSRRANEVLDRCLEQIEQLDQKSQQKYLSQISAIRSLTATE